MKKVTTFIHDGNVRLEPLYVWDTNVDAYIAEWKEILFPEAKKANKDHYIYCLKLYDKDNNLIQLVIHMQPLDEIEFDKKVNAAYKVKKDVGLDIWFGCWHKGTDY